MLYENHAAGNASENRLGHDVVSDSAISCRALQACRFWITQGRAKGWRRPCVSQRRGLKKSALCRRVMAQVMFDHKVTVANAGHQHPRHRNGNALRADGETDAIRDAEHHGPIGIQRPIRTRYNLLISRRRDSPD